MKKLALLLLILPLNIVGISAKSQKQQPPNIKIIYPDAEPFNLFVVNMADEDMTDKKLADLISYVRNIYKNYGQPNVDIRVYDWNPKEAENVYRNTIYDLFGNFSRLPFVALETSSIGLVDITRKNVGQKLWIETQYHNRMENIGLAGLGAIGFILGGEVFDGTINGIGLRGGIFLTYQSFPSTTLVRVSPPHSKYEHKIKNFHRASRGLHLRSNITETLYLDCFVHSGLDVYKTAGQIKFVLPKNILSDDELYRVSKKIAMPITVAADWTTDNNNPSPVTILVGDWREHGLETIKYLALGNGLTIGLGYGLELPGGAIARPNLYVDFFHIAKCQSGSNFDFSMKMFDLVPGLEIDFSPAGVVEISLSARYRKPIRSDLYDKARFEFGIDFTSTNGAYRSGIKYIKTDRENSSLGLSMGYRF
ncbi:MAG: hypothetical protein LBB24_00180 [Rickettsiales bacterium]|nr:hypothetical protein [Rickettsiales bacterium]